MVLGYDLNGGDTHLTIHDTLSNFPMKVDMRIIHDRIRQRYNVEEEVGVFEAEEEAANVKFTNDRCKLMIESKLIIDRFLLDGCLIDSVLTRSKYVVLQSTFPKHYLI